MATLTHQRQARIDWPTRLVPLALTVALLGYAAGEGLTLLTAWLGGAPIPVAGDYRIYIERAGSWLAGNGFYQPWQLTGEPYAMASGAATYPPVALLLFAPFTVLPAVLWWAIPLGLFAAAIVRMRPTRWAIVLLAFVAAEPRTWTLVFYGNPSMWALAFLAAGMVWQWPSALVPFKLTLAPFGLIGIRHGSWWKTVAVGLVLCIPFGLMWLDYATAMLNARTTHGYGTAYLLGEWPIALAIVGAGYLSRRAGAGRSPATVR